MELRTLVSRTLVTFVALGLFSISAASQTRPRILHAISDRDDVSCSPQDYALVAAAATETKPVWEAKPKPTIDLTPSTTSTSSGFIKFEPLLLTAIEQRLGSRYSWGATGPDRFDCSGFVWSIFQEAGINFERASARTLFARFSAPPVEEQYQFGTLVFFSGLAHVGVVADENGFYHASRHHGVIYSKFDDYWTKRIDGFRRVPLANPTTAQLTSSYRYGK
jgi:cell wall-associated NlpC family hydrolase